MENSATARARYRDADGRQSFLHIIQHPDRIGAFVADAIEPDRVDRREAADGSAAINVRLRTRTGVSPRSTGNNSPSPTVCAMSWPKRAGSTSRSRTGTCRPHTVDLVGRYGCQAPTTIEPGTLSAPGWAGAVVCRRPAALSRWHFTSQLLTTIGAPRMGAKRRATLDHSCHVVPAGVSTMSWPPAAA